MKTIKQVFPILCILFILPFSGQAQEFGNIRLTFDAGFGYRTAPTEDDATALDKEIIDRLRGGFLINGKFQYFFPNNFGVGLTIENYSAKEDFQFASEDGRQSVRLEASDNIIFIAPEITTRTVLGNGQHSFIFGFAVGYVGLTSEAKFPDSESQLSLSSEASDSTIGFGGSIGYDYLLSESIALGATFNYLAANFTTEIEGQEVENSQSRIGIKAGIRLYL